MQDNKNYASSSDRPALTRVCPLCGWPLRGHENVSRETSQSTRFTESFDSSGLRKLQLCSSDNSVTTRRISSLAIANYALNHGDPGEWVPIRRNFQPLDWFVCPEALSGARARVERVRTRGSKLGEPCVTDSHPAIRRQVINVDLRWHGVCDAADRPRSWRTADCPIASWKRRDPNRKLVQLANNEIIAPKIGR